MSIRSRDQIKNHGKHHDRNNEFECTMIHQQLMMDGESDLVFWKQVRKRWRLIKCQNLSCLLFQKVDDLNATVIEVMTDVEVLVDGSSVVDVFAVNSAQRKRVGVSERKLTESDRKLFRKAKELELQSWLDHRVFDLVKKKLVDQERVMRARWVLTWKSTGKAKARLCVLGFQDPDLTEVPRDSPTLSAASEALIMQWVASHKYRLISGDIKTAFLSGDEDIRNILF